MIARLALTRIVAALPVLLVVSMLVFFITHIIPGDPTAAMVGSENVDPAVRARLIEEFGLDDSIPQQYFAWLRESIQGNFGVSFRTREPVEDLIRARFLVTAHVAVIAICIAVITSIPLGLAAATHRNQKLDVVLTFISSIGVSVPSFFVAVILIYLFALRLDLLPPSGFVYFWDDPRESWQRLALPAFSLSLPLTASLMRQVRSAALEVLHQDYVRTAVAKGLGGRSVLYRHVLRNALLPVMTILGLQMSSVLSGSVIVETMFAIPGFGRLGIDAIRGGDTPTLQAVVLVTSVLVVLLNATIDAAYVLVDPRIGRGSDG